MNIPKILGILFVLLLLFVGACSTIDVVRVDTGHEAVKINLTGDKRGVDDMSYVTGWVTYSPLTTKIVQFPINTQTVDYNPFQVRTKDGAVFTIDPTIMFEVKPQHTAQVYRKYRKDLPEIETTAIFAMIKDAYKNTTNQYTSDSLMGQQTKFENQVQSNLAEQMNADGFHLDRLTSGITPPETLQRTIDAKNEAIQNALRINNEVASAQAEGKIMVAKSTAAAQAAKIDADARAYTNQKQQQTLTPLIIEQQRIAKWDGAYPGVVTGGGSTMLNIK